MIARGERGKALRHEGEEKFRVSSSEFRVERQGREEGIEARRHGGREKFRVERQGSRQPITWGCASPSPQFAFCNLQWPLDILPSVPQCLPLPLAFQLGTQNSKLGTSLSLRASMPSSPPCLSTRNSELETRNFSLPPCLRAFVPQCLPPTISDASACAAEDNPRTSPPCFGWCRRPRARSGWLRTGGPVPRCAA